MSVFHSEAGSDADLIHWFGYMFMNYSFVVVDMGSSIGSAKDFNFMIHNKSTIIQKFEEYEAEYCIHIIKRSKQCEESSLPLQ